MTVFPKSVCVVGKVVGSRKSGFLPSTPGGVPYTLAHSRVRCAMTGQAQALGQGYRGRVASIIKYRAIGFLSMIFPYNKCWETIHHCKLYHYIKKTSSAPTWLVSSMFAS